MIYLKRIGDYAWGLVLIALGVILTINALGIANINIFFKGWWTLFLIIPSIVSIIEGNDKKISFIVLIVGILLLLSSRNIINFAIVGRLIFPILLILFGLSILFKKDKKNEINKVEIDKDAEEIDVTFGEQNVKIIEDFKSKILSAVFGKITFDISDAKIKKEANIKAEAIFGSVSIIVPEDCQVKTKSSSIFGSVTNNCQNNTGNKVINIEANSIFGGIVINEHNSKNN